MRILLALIAAAGALGACQSEDEVKTKYRAQKNQECLETLRQNPDSAMLDAERFCGCVLDRQMAGKSGPELEKTAPTPEQTQEWGIACADASLRQGAAGGENLAKER
jgi:hypothetical protein